MTETIGCRKLKQLGLEGPITNLQYATMTPILGGTMEGRGFDN